MRSDDLHGLLEEAVPALPPSPVNVGVAVQTARRLRRRRRIAGAVAAGAVPGMISVAMLTGASGTPGAVGSAPDPAVPTSTAAGATAPSGPSRSPGAPAVRVFAGGFDPLIRNLNVGHVPPSVVEEEWDLSVGRQVLRGYESSARRTGVEVIVLAPGLRFGPDETAIGLPDGARSHGAQPVRDLPAHCMAPPDDPDACPVLRWQYAPDAWASVSYRGRLGRTRAETARVVRAVAESVGLTATEPVRLPFWLTGGTADLAPLDSLVRVPRTAEGAATAGPWYVRLRMDAGTAPARTAGAPVVALSIEAETMSGRSAELVPRAPTVVVGGRRVWVGQGGAVLLHGDRAGPRLAVTDPTRHAADAFLDLRMVDRPADRAAWTDVPLT